MDSAARDGRYTELNRPHESQRCDYREERKRRSLALLTPFFRALSLLFRAIFSPLSLTYTLTHTLPSLEITQIQVEAVGRWFASLARKRRLNLPVSHCEDGHGVGADEDDSSKSEMRTK